jgi:hypothetical protein
MSAISSEPKVVEGRMDVRGVEQRALYGAFEIFVVAIPGFGRLTRKMLRGGGDEASSLSREGSDLVACLMGPTKAACAGWLQRGSYLHLIRKPNKMF